jgi:hypothetical protein
MEKIRLMEQLGNRKDNTIYAWYLGIWEGDENYYLLKNSNVYQNNFGEEIDIDIINDDDIVEYVSKDTSDVEKILDQWRDERD